MISVKMSYLTWLSGSNIFLVNNDCMVQNVVQYLRKKCGITDKKGLIFSIIGCLKSFGVLEKGVYLYDW